MIMSYEFPLNVCGYKKEVVSLSIPTIFILRTIIHLLASWNHNNIAHSQNVRRLKSISNDDGIQIILSHNLLSKTEEKI